MITLLHPADVLNKGQIYLCPFGLNIDLETTRFCAAKLLHSGVFGRQTFEQ